MNATISLGLVGLLARTRIITWSAVATLLLAALPQAWAGVTVTLTAPANGATYTAPANITLTATASATQGYTLSKVEFFHGTTLIGTDLTSPYSFDWNSVAAGTYAITAKATAVKKGNPDQTATSAVATITVNALPTVSLTSPDNNAVFAAPANITLAATVADSDGTITKVEFYRGTSLINTDTTSPYSYTDPNVAAGPYSYTAKAYDNSGGITTSAAVNVTVNAAVAMYYIHPDHLNSPRLITNQAGQAVWRWDNLDPFGNNPADENPSGLGTFTCNLRFPGQYFDKETNLHYNYFRDFDPAIGRYIQSDPIGLAGGINTYAYVNSNPLSFTDPFGLQQIPFPLPGGVDPGRVTQAMACAQNPAACNPSGPLVELQPPPTSCEECRTFLQTCYATAGGSGLGLGQVVKSVVTAAIPQARITATVAGAVSGTVTGQNLSLQCQKAFNECMNKVCRVCY